MHYLFERKIIYLRKDERNEETSYCNSNRRSCGSRTGDVAKSIASDEVFQIAVCVIVGDRKIVEKAIEITGENLKINEIKEPEEAVDEKGVLNLINLDNVDMDTFAYGKVSAMCGKAAYEYIAKSIELDNAGKGRCSGYYSDQQRILHAAEVPSYRTYRDLWSTDTYRRSVDNVRDEWNESILPDTSCIVKADAGYDQKRQDH
mgnify:CR=1 FL=1